MEYFTDVSIYLGNIQDFDAVSKVINRLETDMGTELTDDSESDCIHKIIYGSSAAEVRELKSRAKESLVNSGCIVEDGDEVIAPSVNPVNYGKYRITASFYTTQLPETYGEAIQMGWSEGKAIGYFAFKDPALDIVDDLPGNDCGECGFKNCLYFSGALAIGRAKVNQCPHITDEVRERVASTLAEAAVSR